MIIKANVAGKDFSVILVDLGSLVDILFKSILDEMKITNLNLEHTSTSLNRFGGKNDASRSSDVTNNNQLEAIREDHDTGL